MSTGDATSRPQKKAPGPKAEGKSTTPCGSENRGAVVGGGLRLLGLLGRLRRIGALEHVRVEVALVDQEQAVFGTALRAADERDDLRAYLDERHVSSSLRPDW